MYKTIALLSRLEVPWSKVYVFVVEEEYAKYTSALQPCTGINIIVGPRGLMPMRNKITDFFDEGQNLLCIDDDIDDILVMNSGNLRSMTAPEFCIWVGDAFNELDIHNCSLFGVYPVRNAFFMKDSPEVSYNLRFIVGAFFGIKNRKHILIDIEEKEDFDRTLKCYYIDKTVIRYNWITIKTSYYKNGGGMQASGVDRVEASKDACRYLLKAFPEYTRLYTGKKSGIWEVRLKDRSTC